MIPVWRGEGLKFVACAQCGSEITVSSLVRQAAYCSACREERRKRSQALANQKMRLKLKAPGLTPQARRSVEAIQVADPSTAAEAAFEANPKPKLAVLCSDLASPKGLTPGWGTPPRLPRRLIKGRCHCGRCSNCQENARWERIFQEKFADPNYYSLRPVHQSSALHSL